ncbi:MAG: hypothetical protein OXG04_13155 [Acidobacteria bacterium]|nr:hypothetical protein [Acidobacteriota bacterium]
MRTPSLGAIVLAVAICFCPSLAAADSENDDPGEKDAGPSLASALGDGAASVTFRYRYEFVADEAFALDAHASTLRTTLGYETAPYRGFSMLLEAENVRPVGNDLYDNLGAAHRRNERFERPVVADPGLTQVNQAALRFAVNEGTVVTLGRQEILLDDQRFVGAVGWRQNHQSFDAARIVTDALPRGRFNYALVRNAHRITGAVDPLTGHLLHASFGTRDTGVLRTRDTGALVLYAHALDYERDRRRSTATVGAEVTGRHSVTETGFLVYEVEAARQADAFDNPMPVDAGYVHVAAGGGYRGVTVRAGWERLGGSPARGQFNTPLATLHPFNGWADKFLATPADGLDDRYVRVIGDSDRIRWTLAYHAFRAATGAARHGRELDLEFVYRTPWRQQIAITAARYDAESHSTDTTKVMVWTTFGF